MTFLELAEQVLKKAKYPLSYNEMWESAKDLGLDKKVGSEGKTPAVSMSAQLYINMRDKKDSIFYTTSRRPTKFWLKSRQNEIAGRENELEAKIEQSQKQEIESKEKRGFSEGDLHQLLVNFLYENEGFNLFCKTINASTSSNKKAGLNEWIHPDIVGIHFPFAFDDFEKNTLDLLSNINNSSYKIYSFELKKFINNANLKECYFQAVSNSSWANEGYLVAYELKDDDEVKNELTRLNSSFGIGVIELKSSQVKFKAKARELDIDTLDMLVRKNKDFKEFIANVNKDIATNDSERIAKAKYDKILNEKELEKYLKEKHIDRE